MRFKQLSFGKIPIEWEVKNVSDYTKTVTDYVANGSFASLKKNVTYYDEPNYAVLLRLVDYNRNFDGDFVFIDKNAYEFLSKTKLYGGEIIISNVGANVGTVFRAPKLNYNMNLGPNSIMLKTKGEDSFYYYWFSSPYGQGSIKSILSGSAQPKFNKTAFRRLEVPVPPLNEQKAIAHILSTLDEKIEVNNEINKKLEGMAQAIFKHWFVDFEFPNEKGEPYKSSGGEMVESELGMIPKGWEVVELSKIANLTMGLSPKSSTYNFDNIGVPLLNGAADFENGLINAKKYTTEPTRVCKKNDLVFCIRATIGNITFSDKEYCLGRGVAAITPKNDNFIGILYFSLLMSMNRLIANATGSVILGLSKPDINDMKLVFPEKRVLDLFSKIANSVFKYKNNSEIETKKLIDARDTLLPKLMSGEIRVPLDSEDDIS